MDGDAYLVVDGRYVLFLHVKDESLTEEAFAREVAAEFRSGEVAAIGRALKTERRSLPLPALFTGEPAPGSEFVTPESGGRFRLELTNVLNPGLFLDQRENRARFGELVQEALIAGHDSPSDGILNLFSYTGAFSVVAHAHGAPRTTSIDVSARYLDWERKNFEASFGDCPPSSRRLRADARDFLRRAENRGETFRFVVLDPPTFSRGSRKAFRAREELVPLLGVALGRLPPDGPGAVFVSTNDAGWAASDFFREVERVAGSRGARVEPGTTPADFGPAYPLKSAFIRRAG